MDSFKTKVISDRLDKIRDLEKEEIKKFISLSIEDIKKRMQISQNEREEMIKETVDRIKWLYRDHYLFPKSESHAYSSEFFSIFIKAFSKYAEINTPYVASIENDSQNAFSVFRKIIEEENNDKTLIRNYDYSLDKFQETLGKVKNGMDDLLNSDLDYNELQIKIYQSLFESGNACVKRTILDPIKMDYKTDFVELDKVLIYKDYISNEINEFYTTKLYDYDTFIKYFPDEYSINHLLKRFPNCQDVENIKVKNIEVIEFSRFFKKCNQSYVKFFLKAEDYLFLKEEPEILNYQKFCYIQTLGNNNIYGKPFALFRAILEELKESQILAKGVKDKTHKLQNKATIFIEGMPGMRNIEAPEIGGYQASLSYKDENKKEPKALMLPADTVQFFAKSRPIDVVSPTLREDLDYFVLRLDDAKRKFAQALGLGEGFNRTAEDQASQKPMTAFEVNLRQKQSLPAIDFFNLIEKSSNELYIYHFNFILGAMKSKIDKALLYSNETEGMTKESYIKTQMMTFDLWVTFKNTAELSPEILKEFNVNEENNPFYNFFKENENYQSVVQIANLRMEAIARKEEIQGQASNIPAEQNNNLEELTTLNKAIDDYSYQLEEWAEYVNKEHRPKWEKELSREYSEGLSKDLDYLIHSLGEDLIEFILFYWETNKKIKFTLTSTDANQARNQTGNNWLQYNDIALPIAERIARFNPEEAKKILLSVNYEGGLEKIAKAYNVDDIVLADKKLEKANEERKQQEIETAQQMAQAQSLQQNNENV